MNDQMKQALIAAAKGTPLEKKLSDVRGKRAHPRGWDAKLSHKTAYQLQQKGILK